MPSLLVVIFLVEVAIQIVNSLGAATISNALWGLYNYIPSQRTALYAQQRKQQADYLQVRAELNATSSQDEFAKWARLRRQHDKLLEQVEKTKSTLDTDRRKFDTLVTTARLLLTRGLQYFLPFWFARTPMFWLPHGWFPAYAEWILAFPRAPRGSVSIASWQLACTGVLVLLRDTLAALAALLLPAWQRATTKQTRQKEAPVAAEGKDAKKTQ